MLKWAVRVLAALALIGAGFLIGHEVDGKAAAAAAISANSTTTTQAAATGAPTDSVPAFVKTSPPTAGQLVVSGCTGAASLPEAAQRTPVLFQDYWGATNTALAIQRLGVMASFGAFDRNVDIAILAFLAANVDQAASIYRTPAGADGVEDDGQGALRTAAKALIVECRRLGLST